jgi:hypothetical protein
VDPVQEVNSSLSLSLGLLESSAFFEAVLYCNHNNIASRRETNYRADYCSGGPKACYRYLTSAARYLGSGD